LTKRGYQPVYTPNIGKVELYQISGHFPYYYDSQFKPIVMSEDERYLLKPMNCPHHIMIYKSKPRSYRDQVLLPSVHARLAVEAGASQGWHRYVGDHGDVLGVDRYGASAPGDVVMREYGFTVDNICKRAMAVLG